MQCFRKAAVLQQKLDRANELDEELDVRIREAEERHRNAGLRAAVSA